MPLPAGIETSQDIWNYLRTATVDPLRGQGFWSGDYLQVYDNGPHRGIDIHTGGNTDVGIYSVWAGTITVNEYHQHMFLLGQLYCNCLDR